MPESARVTAPDRERSVYAFSASHNSLALEMRRTSAMMPDSCVLRTVIR